MNIERARKLKPGDMVHCPPDRGEPGYFGTVCKGALPEEETKKNIHGDEYVWIVVTGHSGLSRHMWPSNRLG